MTISQKKLKQLRRKFNRSKATVRTVRTVYYADYDAQFAVKTNNSQFPNRAAVAAHWHMRAATYMAVLAEVFDDLTGKQYAVIKMEVDGSLKIVYQSEADQIDLIRGV